MVQSSPSLQELTQEHIEEMLPLLRQLNPEKYTDEYLKNNMAEMFTMNTYHCFGLYVEGKPIGVSSGWLTNRFYSGKQLELDNVIIDANTRSNGLGKLFFDLIEDWAKQRNCYCLELNTYVTAHRAQKFYFNLGFIITGYRFKKTL